MDAIVNNSNTSRGRLSGSKKVSKKVFRYKNILKSSIRLVENAVNTAIILMSLTFKVGKLQKTNTVFSKKRIFKPKKAFNSLVKLTGIAMTCVSVIFTAWMFVSWIDIVIHNLEPHGAVNNTASWNLIVGAVDYFELEKVAQMNTTNR